MYRRLASGSRWVFLSLAVILCLAGRAQGQDCNNNGIPDGCDTDCGTPGGPCNLPGCGTAADDSNVFRERV